MPVSVVLPRALTRYAHGLGTVQLEASCATVREALDQVAERWPALVDRVLTEQGEVRRHVNIFVGDESIAFLDGLGTAIADGTTITIVPAVSGG
jgi:molybdopterin synthase sulfur carrier subunit